MSDIVKNTYFALLIKIQIYFCVNSADKPGWLVGERERKRNGMWIAALEVLNRLTA
jgi:hypothetical protein